MVSISYNDKKPCNYVLFVGYAERLQRARTKNKTISESQFYYLHGRWCMVWISERTLEVNTVTLGNCMIASQLAIVIIMIYLNAYYPDVHALHSDLSYIM